MSLKVKTHALPSGYTELEYIEAVGTGVASASLYYIDTGVTTTLNTEIETDIKHISTNQYIFTPFALNKIGNNTGWAVSEFSVGPAWAVKGGTSTWQNMGTIPLNTNCHILLNKDGFTVNDTFHEKAVSSYSATETMFIMCSIWDSSISAVTTMQMKEFIMRESGVETFHGIPAKNSDAVVGMYDTVSGTFKTNGGTGTLTAGPEVTTPTKALKEIHELYKRNSAGTDKEYIGEGYQATKNKYFSTTCPTSRPSTWTEVECPLAEGATFTASIMPGDATYHQIAYYKADGTYIDYYNFNSTTSGGRKYRTFTVPANVKYWCIYSSGGTAEDTMPMILEGTASGAQCDDYIPHLVHIFSAGYDVEVSGNVPLTITDARPKPTSWKIDGQSKQSVLPEGYTQLEYLETDGNSCINTNLMITGNESWECVFENAGSNNLTSQVLGTLNGGSAFTVKNNFSITYTSAMNPPAYAVYLDGNNGSANAAWDGGVLTDHTKQTIRYTGLNTAPTINGVAMTQLTPTTLIALTPTVGVRLFGRATTTGNGTFAQSGVRIYSFKGDTWNFIPAKNSSSVLGMYDLVSGQFFTNAGTGIFTAGPATPTPTNPVDVRAVGNSGLPSGYKKLEYIQSSGTQYINTSLVPTSSTKTYIDYSILSFVTSGTCVGAHSGSDYTTNNYYPVTQLGSSLTSFRSVLGAKATQYEWESPLTNRHQILFNDNLKMYLDGNLVKTWTEFTSVPTSSIYLFWASGLPQGEYLSPAKIYSCKIWQDGATLSRNFIPAQRKSDSVIGMYDTVTNTFFTNQGTGDFIAGPEDTSCVVPILQVNNCGMVDLSTIENLTYRSDLGEGIFFVNTNWWGNPKKELGIENLYLNGYTISESGAAGMGDMTICGHLTAYVLYIRDTRYNDVESFKAAMLGKYLYYQRETDTTWNTPTITNITLPAPLQKIGTYKDTIESDGTLTRGVGKVVLTGNESWSTYTYQSSPNAYYITISDMIDTEASTSSSLFMNTHLQWAQGVWASSDIGYAVSTMKRMFLRRNTTDTIDTWKAWLAEQYSQGTPVIVYYPLAEATTSTVDVPVISTQKGTNYIDVETDVKPSNVSVTYRKRSK